MPSWRQHHRRNRLFAVLLTGLALLGSAPAYAHAYLIRAVPAIGRTVNTAPSHLTLYFSEGVVAHFCTVSLTGGGGRPVHLGELRIRPGHDRVLLVPLPHLAPGHYTVTWHAVSTDTHKTQGRFGFTVAGRTP